MAQRGRTAQAHCVRASQDSESPARRTRTPRRERITAGLASAICCGAQFMVILDLSIVNVALPSIQASLGFSSIDLQWVVDAYAVIFAGFLMLAGPCNGSVRPAAHARRRAAGLRAGVAGGRDCSRPDAPDRRSWRSGLRRRADGGGVARRDHLVVPRRSCAASGDRSRGAMNGAGGAAGVFFGGVITQALGWRWILLVNTPIATATGDRRLHRRGGSTGRETRDTASTSAERLL